VLHCQGLLQDEPAILLVGGGEGMGKLQATVQQLDAKLQGAAQVRRQQATVGSSREGIGLQSCSCVHGNLREPSCLHASAPSCSWLC
jgi:hypothetical protein